MGTRIRESCISCAKVSLAGVAGRASRAPSRQTGRNTRDIMQHRACGKFRKRRNILLVAVMRKPKSLEGPIQQGIAMRLRASFPDPSAGKMRHAPVA